MSLYLRFTTGSPFARAVRVVLAEKGLDYESVEEITTTSAEERAGDAPTLQVPAFRDGDRVLWDSAVIIEHLMANYPSPPANPIRWSEPGVTGYEADGTPIYG